MATKTLPREPWRGGQLCGYQSEYGAVPGRSVFCGEYKAPGLYFCQEHHNWVLGEYGSIRLAPGNAAGLELKSTVYGWSVYDGSGALCGSSSDRADLEERYGFTLKWAPYEGQTPQDPTAEELAHLTEQEA